MRPLRAALALVLLLAACDGAPEDPRSPRVPQRTPALSPTADSGPVIGLVGTMSGPGAWRGEDAFEGADLAVHVLNHGAPEDAEPFGLVTRDDRGEPERATELVREMVEDPRVVGIVYAGPPSGAAPAVSAVEDAGVPLVVCFGDLHSAGLLGSHVFQVSPPLLWQARRLASYIRRDRGYRRVGMLVQGGMDAQTAQRVTRAALRQRGLAAFYTRHFESEEDLTRGLDALASRRVEALLVHGSPDALPEVVAALRDRGSLYRTTAAARTASAPARVRRRERRTDARRTWRPQVMGFDLSIAPRSDVRLPAGTVASDTYARGAHLLPIPSLRRFRDLFEDWWGAPALGWERRAFDAVSMIGWAAQRAPEGGDVAESLERIDGRRFGGLDVSFGPDDHTGPMERAVGLWVVPR